MSAARRLGGRGPRGALVITRWRPEGAAAAGGDVDATGSPRAGAASPLTPGGGPIGGETEQVERGVIIGVCEQFVDAWWRGVARGVDSATDSFSQLLAGAPRAATPATPATAATPAAPAKEGGGGGPAAADAAHPSAGAHKHDHHLHLSWRRGHHQPKRPAAWQGTAQEQNQQRQPQLREAPEAREATSSSSAAGDSSSSSSSSTTRSAASPGRTHPQREEAAAPANVVEVESAFVLVPDGVLHRRPLRGYGALLTQLAAQHAEYHRVQYRPVASAADVRSGVGYVLGEFRMQDVGGLAGHPATFRISKGNCLYKFKVDNVAGADAAPQADAGAGGASAASGGGGGGGRHLISRGWVRRQMTQEERDERVWDPVHVYPAPFPMERLHLTRGARPDAAAMQEAACAWVAAQAKPRRRSAATSAAPAAPAAATGGMDERPQEQAEQQAGVAQRGSRGVEEGGGGGGADAGGAAAGGVISISTLGQITSTDPHRADMIPDTIAGNSRSASSDSSGSSRGSSPSYGGGCSGVCGRALEQARGAPRLLLCSWSSRGVAAAALVGAHSAHAATAGASAGATPAAGMAGAPEDEAAEEWLGPTRVQQHVAASVLSQNCRLHDAYGIYPSPEDLRLLPGAAGAGGYGSMRSQQPVLGPQAILQRLQSQQRLTDHVEPLLQDVAVSADHNIAFVHYVNIITPAAAPVPAPTAPEPAASTAATSASSSASPSSAGATRRSSASSTMTAAGASQQQQGNAAASPMRSGGAGAALKPPSSPLDGVGGGADEARGTAGGPAAAAGDVLSFTAGDAVVHADLSHAGPTTIPDAGLGLQVSGGGSSPAGGDLTSSSSSSRMAAAASSIAAVSNVATAAANAATAAAQAATTAAGVATTAASAANAAASTANTAATMAATAATAAAFMAASTSQQQDAIADTSAAAVGVGAGQGPRSATPGAEQAAESGASYGATTPPRSLPPPAAAASSLQQRDGNIGGGSGTAGGGGGGGSDGPLGSLDLRLQERLQDLRLAMPQVQMQMPAQMQGLEEVITAAAQRVAGAAGTAAAAASAAAAAATAVIMAEQQAQQQQQAVGGKVAGGGAAEQHAAGAAAPPPPPVPYQQENMAALLFDDDGAVTDVWLLRSPFHWERRLLRP